MNFRDLDDIPIHVSFDLDHLPLQVDILRDMWTLNIAQMILMIVIQFLSTFQSARQM